MDKPTKTPPAYSITSVDHALRIAAMLQLEGALGVSEVAERLGVARSTAHRLLSMLVYRDFATHGPDRRYRPGLVMTLPKHSERGTALLRQIAIPHLTRLTQRVGETTHLSVRTGRSVRVPVGVEADHELRVGSHEAMVFPAHTSATGRLMLADLPDQAVEELYADGDDDPLDAVDLAQLKVELAEARGNGFAINDQRTELGVVHVAVPVRVAGRAVASVGVSMPTRRYDRRALPELLREMRGTVAALEADLDGAQVADVLAP